MGDPARRPATYADVLAAPDGMTAEILAGELHLSPRPSASHQVAASEIGFDLGSAFRRGRGGPGGWILLHEVELHLGDPVPESEVAVPDLSGWRRERMPHRPTAPAITLPPDWVCEVLSPGPRNVRRDRMLKGDLYHRAGIPWMWLVDPVAQLVEVYRREDEGYLRVHQAGGADEARLPPFDAVAFDLSNWWAGPTEG